MINASSATDHSPLDLNLRQNKRTFPVFYYQKLWLTARLRVSKRRRKSPPRSCLTTVAMSKQWQKRGNPESMAPHVLGPRAFDMHVSFTPLSSRDLDKLHPDHPWDGWFWGTLDLSDQTVLDIFQLRYSIARWSVLSSPDLTSNVLIFALQEDLKDLNKVLRTMNIWTAYAFIRRMRLRRETVKCPLEPESCK